MDVFFSCDQFRSYIVDARVRVHTDRDVLKEILERKEHNPRLIRWILLLQEFELQIMQKQKITAAIVGTKHPKRIFHLIERNFSLGDIHLRELSEKLKPIPRKRKKSLLLEELEPPN